ncbi:MAG: hypothetical protein OEW05_04735 [Candidatus Aminicenantes bacterium]|nr:hypothetical protein [Candidatus Aminicenantes bacterium]
MTPPTRRKLVRRLILVLAAAYALWLAFAILTYRVYRSGPAPVASPPYEAEGVYHLHTKHSDGRGRVEDIVRTVRGVGLDFVLLTDHGNPNRASVAEQGWREGLLLLAGSELNVNRGHLVGLGFALPERDFSRLAEDAVGELNAQGGFAVIAHPYSKTRWTWGEPAGYAGIEVINADNELKKHYPRLIPYAPALLLRPTLALLRVIDTPAPNLRKWDEMTSASRVAGYYATDAHVFYGALLRAVRLHVLLDAPLPAAGTDFAGASAAIHGALREGRFYNAIEAAAEADGFRFEARVADGSRRPMGAEVVLDPAAPPVFAATVPYDFATETHLVCGGRTVARTTETLLLHKAAEPGAYRVEVYLRERSPLSPRVPWILSNPIYVRKKG